MFEIILDVFLDALKDSILTLPVLFICYLLIELLEEKILTNYQKNKLLKGKFAPVISAGFGIIPQCGFSVVASELYAKRAITIGSLFAIFIATSDEALPILLSNPSSYLSLVIIIGVKFLYAVIVGLAIDLIVRKVKVNNLQQNLDNNSKEPKELQKENKELECEVHGCCHHELEHNEKGGGKLSHLFVHPLIHSLKIFLFIFLINIIFGLIIEFVGEDVVTNFMLSTGFFEPFIVSIVGLIPNCAASVLITELFLSGSIKIGSCIAGLSVNSGLALIMLFKFNKNIKQNLGIVGLLYALSCLLGVVINII